MPAITQHEYLEANLSRKFIVGLFLSISLLSSGLIEKPVENISGKITKSPEEMIQSPKISFTADMFLSGSSHSISFW